MGEIFDALRRADLFDEDLKPAPASAPAVGELRDVPPAALELTQVVTDEVAEDSGTRVELSTELMADWVARAVVAAPTSDAASRYRHAAIRLRQSLKQGGGSLLAISSANASEGKTTTSCNLALALASMTSGGRVALVDVDLRSPRVASALGVEIEVGFERVVSGDASLGDARIRTQFESLDLYPSRCFGRDSHEVLSSSRFAGVMGELDAQYDAVVLDCPPVLPVPDSRLIAEHAHACMLVVRAGATRTKAIEEALAYLAHAKMAGIFVNCLERRGSGAYYYAYGEREAS